MLSSCYWAFVFRCLDHGWHHLPADYIWVATSRSALMPSASSVKKSGRISHWMNCLIEMVAGREILETIVQREFLPAMLDRYHWESELANHGLHPSPSSLCSFLSAVGRKKVGERFPTRTFTKNQGQLSIVLLPAQLHDLSYSSYCDQNLWFGPC